MCKITTLFKEYYNVYAYKQLFSVSDLSNLSYAITSEEMHDNLLKKLGKIV